jgi:hypothetical protein
MAFEPVSLTFSLGILREFELVFHRRHHPAPSWRSGEAGVALSGVEWSLAGCWKAPEGGLA